VSPAERAYWLRANRRIAGLQPDVQAALLRAFAIVRDSFTDSELAQLIASGNFERIVTSVFSEAVLDRAFIPTRYKIRTAIDQGFKFSTYDLPKGGKVDGQIAVMFDHLSPDVIAGIRTLETKVITSLKSDIRETVRAVVQQGITDGVGPRAIARNLRSVIGMSPTQEMNAVKRAAKLADEGKTQVQIDKAMTAYRRKAIALNAETNARTATLDAFKQGQRLSWKAAVDQGIVPPERLMHQWIGVMDDRERPEHVAMEKEVQPFDVPYSNGELVPGESTYNCRCLDRVFVA
jgi:uncharacterized protein with gpF-like domain